MGIDFPHAAQVFRNIRYVGDLHGQRRTKEIAYGLTSLLLRWRVSRPSQPCLLGFPYAGGDTSESLDFIGSSVDPFGATITFARLNCW